MNPESLDQTGKAESRRRGADATLEELCRLADQWLFLSLTNEMKGERQMQQAKQQVNSMGTKAGRLDASTQANINAIPSAKIHLRVSNETTQYSTNRSLTDDQRSVERKTASTGEQRPSQHELAGDISMIRRITVFVYGIVSYSIFFCTFLYAYGFVGNLFVPKSIDSAPQGPWLQALLVNGLLLGIFAVQHSVMARPAFKRLWTKMIPQPAERSTYVLFSSLALILMFWQWRPMGGVVWNVEDPIGRSVLLSLFALGGLLVLWATFLINHFDLFGLRQVTLYLSGREYTRLKFKTPGLYRFIRHPLYLGWLLTFWSTPTMTVAHLVFAVATTTYILMAIRWEERDLVSEHGKTYEDYRQTVPMLIPTGTKKNSLREALN